MLDEEVIRREWGMWRSVRVCARTGKGQVAECTVALWGRAGWTKQPNQPGFVSGVVKVRRVQACACKQACVLCCC